MCFHNYKFVIDKFLYYMSTCCIMGQVRDDILLKEIAKKVKDLRREKKMSQLELLFELNIHIGRIEAGKNNLTVSSLNVICKYSGLTLGQFFTELEKGNIKKP